MAKQQISVNFNCRARDEVKFSQNSSIFFVFFVRLPINFQFFNFLNSFNFEKKTSVARSRGPHPFTFGKPSAGPQKRARGPLPARGPILWPPLV